jgi:DsbC/DsbD-like thiol-disulfide interchange protein
MLRSIRTLAVVVAIAAAVPALAQIDMNAPGKPKSYVLYAAEAQSVAANKSATLELRFQVVSGYHVNSHTPKSQLLIPTILTLQPAAGVKEGDLQYPQGVPYSFSFDPGDKLDVYAGNFVVKVPVVASAGAHTIEGSLRYQACDNASCYPPRNLPVKVIFTAK